MSTNGQTPYERTKKLLENLNIGVPRGERFTVDGERSVLAMARKNDPFYAGQDWQRQDAAWFAELFHRLGFGGRRVHLRFMHYVASGEEASPDTGEKQAERLPDGTPYENTEENWKYMQEASKYARNMGLVDPRNIVDQRTPRPFFNVPSEPAETPYILVSEPELRLPTLEVSALEPRLAPASANSYGYEYDVAREPSLIELWMEKNLDNEDDPVIEGLCEELGVNLVTGIGFMTISSVYSLLERRAKLDKPLRILYLSDFDPAGKAMPVSPARHIEFAIRNMDPRPDIRLHHLALTEEQVRKHRLPRIPIKESDLRKPGFEKRHGVGAVELNAMMHEMRVADFEEILRSAVLSLRDEHLPQKLREAEREADALLEEEIEGRLRWPQRALGILEARAREIGERYVEELQDIAARLEEDMAPLEAAAERVRLGVRRRLEGLEDTELPQVEAEEPPDAADSWLFDSRRTYLAQLRHYKAH